MRLAARGARDMDSGVESITDPEERAALRHRALIIVARATLIAVLITLIASVGPAH
jgi:hypothetical protein